VLATPVSDRSGEWQQQALCGWRDKHAVEPPKRCEQAQGTAARRGVNGAETTERYEPWA